MDWTSRRFLRRLGDRRRALDLTRAELADPCGLHRTFIGSVERGERNVSVLNLRSTEPCGCPGPTCSPTQPPEPTSRFCRIAPGRLSPSPGEAYHSPAFTPPD